MIPAAFLWKGGGLSNYAIGISVKWASLAKTLNQNMATILRHLQKWKLKLSKPNQNCFNSLPPEL